MCSTQQLMHRRRFNSGASGKPFVYWKVSSLIYLRSITSGFCGWSLRSFNPLQLPLPSHFCSDLGPEFIPHNASTSITLPAV